MKHPKFRVTYELNGAILSNIIEPETEDLYFLYIVQKSVAEDWGRKLCGDLKTNVISRLVSIEQL